METFPFLFIFFRVGNISFLFIFFCVKMWNSYFINSYVTFYIVFSVYIPRLLQKARLKRNNAVVIRDSLRNEMSKRSKTEEDNREKREQLVSTLIG